MALLTNFDNREVYRYQNALDKYIRETGDKSIYIDRNAYVRGGRKDETMYALRVNREGDCSSFWRIFESIPKICPMCNKEHFEFGTYCSLRCRADSIEMIKV